eukprot:gnl/MRDRNA2_/MRDRNA2_79483_c0_seq1.p1 gnl/MRDRNA2_/MRDRNA2_79483_c0~~gnl/MRDRNA2_/MRDRNA2_79483_c0_seq1.p1  ORF type:complete len:382 (+),score=37.21 gnl/MRDRNA2_/MRDRNA2_79483_c0_seq1:167-1312(+)
MVSLHTVAAAILKLGLLIGAEADGSRTSSQLHIPRHKGRIHKAASCHAKKCQPGHVMSTSQHSQSNPSSLLELAISEHSPSSTDLQGHVAKSSATHPTDSPAASSSNVDSSTSQAPNGLVSSHVAWHPSSLLETASTPSQLSMPVPTDSPVAAEHSKINNAVLASSTSQKPSNVMPVLQHLSAVPQPSSLLQTSGASEPLAFSTPTQSPGAVVKRESNITHQFVSSTSQNPLDRFLDVKASALDELPSAPHPSSLLQSSNFGSRSVSRSPNSSVVSTTQLLESTQAPSTVRPRDPRTSQNNAVLDLPMKAMASAMHGHTWKQDDVYVVASAIILLLLVVLLMLCLKLIHDFAARRQHLTSEVPSASLGPETIRMDVRANCQ